jgi:hypothetical protein
MVSLKNLQAWSKSGLSANKDLLNFSQQAINNPNAFLDSLMSGYGASDIFNRRVNKASNLLRNQMSARGLTGSSFAEEKMLENINNLVGDDMQQYLTNNFNLLNAGLGTANNLNSLGLSAENNAQQLQMQQDAFDYNKEQNAFLPQLLKGFIGNLAGGLSSGLGGGLQQSSFQNIMQGFGKRNPNTPAGFNYNWLNQQNQNLPSFFATK